MKICKRCKSIDNFIDYEGESMDGQEFDEKGKPIDNINHPKHYTFGTIEVIEVIEDWQLGFHEGNCVKYIARAKYKGNELEDLKKAEWYLKRKIQDIELEIATADSNGKE